MRRGAQSMYQPGNKSTVTSKLIHNNSSVGPQGGNLGGLSGLHGKSMINPTRKVEGHDLAKTTKTNFEQTVQNLKSKPNQKVLQDQYINGLQEQIKYLQYQLKLLKDKQILQREGVNQLDNFLKDQIPINQNILAMKNKYNATKAKLESQLSNLNMKKGEAEDVLATQKNQIQRLHQIINAHRKQKNQRRGEFKQKLREIVKEITMTVDQYSATGDDNRRMQQHLKKMNEQISIIQRQAQKQKVAQVRATEQKVKRQQKFDQKVKQTKQEMIQTTQQSQQLDELQDKNPLIQPMQDQNSLLRKKIMLNQKQKSTAQNNIAEIQLFLKEEERQRELERQHKNKYIIIGDDCKLEIQTLDREADNILKEKTLRTKKIMLKESNTELHEKEEVYDLLTDRLRNLEQECSNLIQEKKELQDSLDDQKRIEKELMQLTTETDQAIIQNRSNADSLRRVSQQIAEQSLPIQGELQKCKGRIPMVQRDIQRKQTTIVYLNKQVDLLKELKNLDLQHLHMISQGGNQMQNVLHSFIKNWEKIKSL